MLASIYGMPQPRHKIISLADTPYYHCISRCVRRAFLCGRDSVTGRSYEHRKAQVVERIKLLSSVFAVDICAYAVMSNHYHIVLRVDSAAAQSWNSREVAKRWCRVFAGHGLVERWLSGETLGQAERVAVEVRIEMWRKRLFDISWFMRCLNEHIARQANAEDGCSGRFWEGRFKSVALLDEAALITCMTYVDLNPVRAGVSKTPEASDYTSIQERLLVLKEDAKAGRKRLSQPGALVPFQDDNDEENPLPIRMLDYVELVDWTGRAVLDHKCGSIPTHLEGVLTCCGINSAEWIEGMQNSERRFNRALGAINRLSDYCNHLGQKWLKGWRYSRSLFLTPG